MQISTIGKGLRRGGLVAFAMTTIIISGCGGGGGGGSSGATANSSGTGSSATGNSAPTISASPTAEVAVGSAYSLTPQATDADGDTLAFSIQNKPQWAQFSTSTGQLSGTPTDTGEAANIIISVSDGKANAALPSFSITVAATTGSPATAGGKSVALSWDVPTQTEDGETLTDLSGYRIHYGTNESALVKSVEVNSSGTNAFTVQGLSTGTYFFAVRAVTASGMESKLSNVITRVVS